MFTSLELYQVTSALESVAFETKLMCNRWRDRNLASLEAGQPEEAEKDQHRLHRSERKLEETRALIFKTEAINRWNEAEKILFPDRFNNNSRW